MRKQISAESAASLEYGMASSSRNLENGVFVNAVHVLDGVIVVATWEEMSFANLLLIVRWSAPDYFMTALVLTQRHRGKLNSCSSSG